ncbi:MAG: M20/M25/M40 family metallo-hydrolase [Thermacetogeniaceae bacterium]
MADINVERLAKEFLALAQISSPSYRERELGNYLIRRLRDLGLSVEEDDAGERIGGNCGNIFARLEGTVECQAIFFCAHMDTVQPGEGVKPVLQDGVFRSDGTTVLGGDDKAGIAAIIELLEVLKENKIAHGPIELLFTVGEEQGLRGSKNFDCSKFRARFGYVLDSSGKPGTIIVAAPTQSILNFTVKGKSAHAGIEPERGINAIQAAGLGLARLRLGRIDAETTANIGVIKGGKATNIVPDLVYLEGEVRSLDRKKMESLVAEIIDKFTEAVESVGAKSEIKVSVEYPEFRLDPEMTVVKHASLAAGRAGLSVSLETSGGGSDANIFNAAGIPTANLGIGMQRVHTVEEFLELKDLIDDVRWLLEIVRSVAEREGKED